MKQITIEKNVSGFLEIGTNDRNEVVINHHDLDIDENGQGFICFSINEAEALVRILKKKIKYLKTGNVNPNKFLQRSMRNVLWIHKA